MPISKGEAKQQISLFIRKEWRNEYAASESGSLYKTFWPDATTGPSDSNISRKYSNILFRIYTGHCRLNKHLHRIGCHENGLCEQCRTDETLQHYLFECPKYHHARQQVTETADRHNVNLNLLDMVRNLYTRVSLVEFVLTTGKDI